MSQLILLGMALILGGCVAVPIIVQDNSAPVTVEILNSNDVLTP